MKTPSSHLHELIGSLTPSEKRYIRRMAISQDASFLKLMDAIASQSIYDEELLKKNYKGEKFLKNLAVNKKYLSDYILNALVQFKKKEEEYAIIEGMSMIEVLRNKSLPDRAIKLLKKLMKRAETMGLYSLAMQLMQQGKDLFGMDIPTKTQKNWYEEGKQYGRFISNNHEYWHCRQRIYRLCLEYQKGQRKREELETELQPNIAQPMAAPQTVESRLYWCESKIAIYDALDDSGKLRSSRKEYLNVLQLNPKYLYRFSHTYLEHSNRYLEECLSLGLMTEFSKGQDMLQRLLLSSVIKKTKGMEAKYFHQWMYLELKSFHQKNEIDEGIVFSESHREQWEELKGQLALPQIFDLHYIAAYFHLLKGNPEEVLGQLQPLMEYHKTDLPPKMMQGARLMNLMARFDLGHQLNFNLLLKKTRRYIKQYRKLYQSEKALFAYLEQAQKTSEFNKNKIASLQLLEDLMVIRKSKEEQNWFRIVDLVHWCENKLKKRRTVIKTALLPNKSKAVG